MMKKQVGFTLMELMVVVAIVGVISAMAFPSYQTYSQRVKRAEDCKSPLLEIAVEMEAFRAVNQTYPPAGLLSATTLTHDATKGNYTYRITASTGNTYTLQCDITGGTIADVDPDCGVLTYDNFGRKGASAINRTIAECWR